MSGTITVKELIKELLNFDMDEPVYIGLGPNGIPSGSSEVHSVVDFCSNIDCGFGVYLVPRDHLIDADKDQSK